MAESLAVRYRPRRFADVAGQRHVTAVLRSAATRPVPPQQILLAGPSGLGKTTTARIFAAALLCEHRTSDGDACGLCPSCLDISAAAHPDVIELDAASNGGKDEIRDLAARAVLAPLRGRWKVYIVDEAHGLTGAGGQAFLRLLEEPPAHCVFILATTDPQKLPTALQGRCTYLEVLPPSPQEVRANLQRIARGEDWDLSLDAADAVIAASDPALGMRGTVMTLDKLAGPLSAGQDLSARELEDLLGVVDPARLAPLTTAILAGDRTSALAAFFAVADLAGRTHLRRQLTAWAGQDLRRAVAAGAGVDQAFHRFSTLVEAPSYDGALAVAVARAADPALARDVDAVRALLERAEELLAQLVGRAPASDAPTAALIPDPPTPTAAVAEPAAAQGPPTPSRAAPTAAVEDPVPEPETAISEEVVTGNDPRVVALLNAVGQVSGPAAFLLRRCQIVAVGPQLRVHVPPAAAAKAAACDLPSVLTRVAAAGKHDVVLAP